MPHTKRNTNHGKGSQNKQDAIDRMLATNNTEPVMDMGMPPHGQYATKLATKEFRVVTIGTTKRCFHDGRFDEQLDHELTGGKVAAMIRAGIVVRTEAGNVGLMTKEKPKGDVSYFDGDESAEIVIREIDGRMKNDGGMYDVYVKKSEKFKNAHIMDDDERTSYVQDIADRHADDPILGALVGSQVAMQPAEPGRKIVQVDPRFLNEYGPYVYNTWNHEDSPNGEYGKGTIRAGVKPTKLELGDVIVFEDGGGHYVIRKDEFERTHQILTDMVKPDDENQPLERMLCHFNDSLVVAEDYANLVYVFGADASPDFEKLRHRYGEAYLKMDEKPYPSTETQLTEMVHDEMSDLYEQWATNSKYTPEEIARRKQHIMLLETVRNNQWGSALTSDGFIPKTKDAFLKNSPHMPFDTTGVTIDEEQAQEAYDYYLKHYPRRSEKNHMQSAN